MEQAALMIIRFIRRIRYLERLSVTCDNLEALSDSSVF